MISEDIREKNEEELQLNETAQAEAINEESAKDFPEGFEESSDNDLSVELELLADELQQPEAEQPEDEQPEAEQPEDEQPEAEQSEDEQPEDEQPEADQSEDEQSEDEQPEAEQPEDEQPEDEQPEADQSEDEQSEDEQPEAEQSEYEQPEDEQPEDEQPEAEQSEYEQPEDEQSEYEQPEAEQSEDEQPEAEQPEDIQPEAGQSEDEQPEAEQSEDEQSEDEQPEAEQSEDEQSEDEQPEDEQPEDEQPEDEQPEAEQPEAEQPEDEQPEAEQPEDEQPEEDGLINERITDLVDDLQEVFNDGSEEDKNEVSSADLFMLANELGSDSEDPDEEFAEERTVEFDLSDRVNSFELNEYSSDCEIVNREGNSRIENDYNDDDDDVRIFVKHDYSSYEEDDDVKAFHGGNQPEPDYSDEEMVIDLSESVGEIEHTNVFELVRPQPTYGGAGGYSPDYAEIRRKKRYGFFKGLAQIAALLAVVVCLAWLLSVVAFSVMGADDTVSADEYNYSTSSTIIKPFKDDQEPEPVVVPDFTAEKLTLGDKGDMVDAVQRTLASLGYLNQGDVSGVYDSTTKNAVVMFQKANYLEATGVVDKSTYQLIFDSNATAPTTRTTDLPTTTEAETQTTGTETPTSASQTESLTSSASSSEETKPTTATSADSSDEDRTSDNPSDTAPTEAEPIISENNDSYLNTSENIGNP